MATRDAKAVVGGAVILIVAAVLGAAILTAAGLAPLAARIDALAGHDAPLYETLFNIAIFGPLLIIALVGGAVDRRNAAAFGPSAVGLLAFGLALGITGISVTVAYAKLAGTLVPVADAGATGSLLAWGTAVVLFQTFAEEVFFRGWLQRSLGRRWGLAPALLATSLLFAALHVIGGARAPFSILNLFLGGLTFGMLAAKGGGIAAALGTHFGWNVAEQLGYGLDPNPGIGSFGSLGNWDLVGPELWGGSAEGLNASLGMTFVMLASAVPLAIVSARALFGRRRRAAPRRVAAAAI